MSGRVQGHRKKVAIEMAVLVVLGGLPGVGKSTIARALCARCGAVLLRIDAIEQAIRDAGIPPGAIGPAGYVVGCAVASTNLDLGLSVVADAVNAVTEARAGWVDTARAAGAALVTAEIVCSDTAEHRRRVETRSPDSPGLSLPGWEAIAARPFAPWPAATLKVDTARLSAMEAVSLIETALDEAAATPRGRRRSGTPGRAR